ncbi:hypothetical protein O3P69_004887 [Scylla paramamosain]|uniref:Uncharacterized protein n=1 Tax=Scylla paramamosain TaxID=85552 RepID=A0AAW0UBG3_SCYPA
MMLPGPNVEMDWLARGGNPQKSGYNRTFPEENEENDNEDESHDPWSLIPHVSSSEAGVGVSVGALARWAGQVAAFRPCRRWLACQMLQAMLQVIHRGAGAEWACAWRHRGCNLLPRRPPSPGRGAAWRE